MGYIQSLNGWKIYQDATGKFYARKGRKWITGAMSLNIIKQTITNEREW